MPTKLPDWELVLSAAARLQTILPYAVLVGGTASAIHAGHRFSRDAVLQELESVAGWKTARVQRPVQILGSLDGIETGVRQLIRDEVAPELPEYKNLASKWHDWAVIKAACAHIATLIFDGVCDFDDQTPTNVTSLT